MVLPGDQAPELGRCPGQSRTGERGRGERPAAHLCRLPCRRCPGGAAKRPGILGRSCDRRDQCDSPHGRRKAALDRQPGPLPGAIPGPAVAVALVAACCVVFVFAVRHAVAVAYRLAVANALAYDLAHDVAVTVLLAVAVGVTVIVVIPAADALRQTPEPAPRRANPARRPRPPPARS